VLPDLGIEGIIIGKVDWQEQHELPAKHPDVFARLMARLIAHDKAVRTEGVTMDVSERGRPGA
jgi:hypothetical protein